MQGTLYNVKVASDPEVKTIAGKECTVFRVAENYKEKGEKKTNWFSVVSPSPKLANIVAKGCVVTVVGDYKESEYNGKKNYTLYQSQVHIATFPDKATSSDPEAASTIATSRDDMPF